MRYLFFAPLARRWIISPIILDVPEHPWAWAEAEELPAPWAAWDGARKVALS